MQSIRESIRGWSQILAWFNASVTPQMMVEVLHHSRRIDDQFIAAATGDTISHDMMVWISAMCNWLRRVAEEAPPLSTNPASRLLIGGLTTMVQEHQNTIIENKEDL